MRSRILLGVLVSTWVILTAVDSVQAQVPYRSRTEILVRVLVPSAQASVWFDDTPTRQKGTDRLYISPPLDAGTTYTYTIKASWTENGRPVTDERRVTVRPGMRTLVNFMERRGKGAGEPAQPGPGVDGDRPLTPRMAPEPGR